MIRFKLDDEAQLFHTSKNSLENNTMFPIPQKPSNFSFGMGVFDLRFQPWYLMSEQVIWPVHSRDVVRPDPLRGTVSVPAAQGSWSQENIPKEVVPSLASSGIIPQTLCAHQLLQPWLGLAQKSPDQGVKHQVFFPPNHLRERQQIGSICFWWW